MKKRFLTSLIAGLSGCVVLAAPKTNLLIITVDDMSADSLGVFGCKVPDTRNPGRAAVNRATSASTLDRASNNRPSLVVPNNRPMASKASGMAVSLTRPRVVRLTSAS